MKVLDGLAMARITELVEEIDLMIRRFVLEPHVDRAHEIGTKMGELMQLTGAKRRPYSSHPHRKE